jgi:hypothetical protein
MRITAVPGASFSQRATSSSARSSAWVSSSPRISRACSPIPEVNRVRLLIGKFSRSLRSISVPRPCTARTMPSCASAAMALRTVCLLTPNCAASTVSGGTMPVSS